MPTVLASGLILVSSSSCSLTGFLSEVPVTLAPGASRDLTSLASTGSVTAENSTGMLVMDWAAAWAVGVAMARTRSMSGSEANLPTMEVLVAWLRPAAFCSS